MSAVFGTLLSAERALRWLQWAQFQKKLRDAYPPAWDWGDGETFWVETTTPPPEKRRRHALSREALEALEIWLPKMHPTLGCELEEDESNFSPARDEVRIYLTNVPRKLSELMKPGAVPLDDWNAFWTQLAVVPIPEPELFD